MLTDPLVELIPGPAVDVAPVIVAARRAVAAALDDLLRVLDGELESAWRWRPADPEDADVRYGFYRIHERLEEATAAIARGRAASGEGPGVGPAVPLFAAATAARWELHGALAGLGDADLDRDPGGGEWTIRQTLGHVVGTQRAYGWYTAWWIDRGHVPGPIPDTMGDDRMPELPEETDEAAGTVAEIRARLDGLVDQAAERMGVLDATTLAVPARWSGLPVTVGFRLGRLSSHIREHTIQVDKTAVMIGRPRSEVERLARLVCTTFGRLESLVFARSAESLARPSSGDGSAASVLQAAGVDVRDLARSVHASVESRR